MAADGATTADPAVFEAAFVIDDSDEPSRANTPKPTSSNLEQLPAKSNGDTATGSAQPQAETEAKGDAQAETSKGAHERSGSNSQGLSEPAAPNSEIPPEIKQRLRKLEKLEATYPGAYLLFMHRKRATDE